MSEDKSENRIPIAIGTKSEDSNPGKRGAGEDKSENKIPIVTGTKSEGFSTTKPNEQFPEDRNAPQPETINHKQETGNMEVHHHGHIHSQKKWKEYLFQFFMLFLAVFCGFLAENQRERLVEAHRAKEYAKSLLDDLRLDTAEVAAGIRQNDFMISAMDSCISIGLKNINRPTVPGSFYYYSRFTTASYSIDWNESTLTQLLPSGNLRYFRNKQLVDKINKYHSLQGIIHSNNETDHSHRDIILALRSRLLSAKHYETFAVLEMREEMTGFSNKVANQAMSQEYELKTGAAGVLEEYINFLQDRKSRNKYYTKELYPKAFNTAAELIEMLKKEYRLE